MQAMFDSVRSVLGEARTVAVERGDPRYAPHRTPLVHALPQSIEEAAEVVRAAFRDRFAIVPVGGNTDPRTGDPDAPPFCLLSTENLDRITAYEPGDQTMTLEAGVSVAAAARAAAKDRLRLAFSPPEPERATVGGVIAAATEGPTAAALGLVRDQLLGVLVVTGDGKLAKAGGRVVKNVTGYDLVRLYAGSRGALAVILETTVRLRPMPESLRRGVFPFADERSALAAGLAVRAKTEGPARLAVFGGAATVELGISAHWALVVEAEGFAQSARAAVLAAAALIDVDGQETSLPVDAGLPFVAPEEVAVVRVTMPPDHWTTHRESVGAALGAPVGVVHDLLRGVRDTWHDPAARIWGDDRVLDTALTAAGATLARPRDPGFHREMLRRLPGQTPGGLAQMRALKTAFDPAGILNPGRTIFG